MTSHKPTTTCLVNNYNYGRYVVEAVQSALAQNQPFDEIVVVDDGSTDDSIDRLTDAKLPSQVRVVTQQNGGQLSAFETGWRNSTGDIVYFLDADDRYHPDLTRISSQCYTKPHVDCVISNHRRIDADGMTIDADARGRSATAPLESVNSKTYEKASEHYRCLGHSLLRSVLMRHWIGGPTSCLSMRREILDQIFPRSDHDQWITRADDVLVFAASIVGGSKTYLDGEWVEYRIHGCNNHAGVARNAYTKWRHLTKLNQLINQLCEQQCFHIGRLAFEIPREFATIERPSFRDALTYIKMGGRANLSSLTRIEQAAVILSSLIVAKVKAKSIPAPDMYHGHVHTATSEIAIHDASVHPPGDGASPRRTAA